MTGDGAPIAAFLLATTLAAPAALLLACLSRNLRARALSLQWLAPVPGLAAAVLVLVDGPAELDIPALRLTLRLDSSGALMLAAAALLWIVVSAGVFKSKAQSDERFAVSWLLTMTGSLGVFIAADLLSFYLVYALVSIPAYGMIVTEARASTIRAGAVYMAFAIFGEALLLLAFAILAAGEPSGGVRIEDVLAALPASPWRDAAIAFIVAGFGMKMGLVPLNGWMPLSYAAGPISAAAVLGGAGVKAGVIGLIRFLPFDAGLPAWGAALMTAGFVSAFYGVAVGLTQRNLFQHQPDGSHCGGARSGSGGRRRRRTGAGRFLRSESRTRERRALPHDRGFCRAEGSIHRNDSSGGGAGVEPCRFTLYRRSAGERLG